MSHLKKYLLSILLCFTLLSLSVPNQTVSALSSSSITFVILSQYESTANIGEEIYIFAFTSNGKQATWKSSNSQIASVNTYGKVTAKKSGTATITAKIRNAEASCKITVKKTKISINKTRASIERDETLKLTASTSSGSEVIWKSSKRSIATVDEVGNVTGIKPGETTISATADGSTIICKLTVKSPTIKLSQTTMNLYRGQTARVSSIVSSKVNPTWKTNKKSVATVDETGTITALKHGNATITATVDGVSKVCEIIVLKPDISLSPAELSLKKGTSTTITVSISSNNSPTWSSSNSNIVSVNPNGEIKALQKGTAYIYALEDGTKARSTIHVTD